MNTLVIEPAHHNGHAQSEPLSGSSLQSQNPIPDPQVLQKPARRRFTTADKLRILKEADACYRPGELGALLRREGLYSSSLHNFRKQRAHLRIARNWYIFRSMAPKAGRRSHGNSRRATAKLR